LESVCSHLSYEDSANMTILFSLAEKIMSFTLDAAIKNMNKKDAWSCPMYRLN